jgi:putative flippase GtrA
MPEPTREPRPKVAAAGIGGAVITVLMFLAPLVNVEIPAEVAAASATLVAFAAAYRTKE